MTNKFFALGLSEHRIWGMVIIPFMLTKEKENTYYKLDHTVFPLENDDSFSRLSNTEKKIVRIIDEYSDQNLYKLFSRHRNLKEFMEKVLPESIESFIRPFIEKKLVQIFTILQGSSIRIFLRERTRNNIFEDDFLNFQEEPVSPVFYFHRSPEGSSYSLQLHSEGRKLELKDRYYDIVTNLPSTLRLDKYLLLIPNIEAKKIKPFFLKDKILIPQKTEVTYFKKFVSKIIQSYEVNARGFEIRQLNPDKSAELSLERSLSNHPVMVLRFHYGSRKIMANAGIKVFVDFNQNNGDFFFDRYNRDENWELSSHDLLNDLELISFDQVNYTLNGIRDLSSEEQLYLLVEWINDNTEELKENNLSVLQKISGKTFFTGKVKLDLSSKLDNDWFDIYAEVTCGEFKIPLIYLKNYIIEFRREFILPDGSIFIIPLDWFGRFKELVEFGKQDDEHIKVHKQHFFIIEKAEKENKAGELFELEKLNNRGDIPPENLPLTLNASLRSYQQDGFTWLWYLQQNNLGGCLADDMGLGKTLQAICLLLKNHEEHKQLKQSKESPEERKDAFLEANEKLTSLIVVPASLVHNWVHELGKFAPSLNVYPHIGFQRDKKMTAFHEKDVIISSYHTIRQDIEVMSSFPFHYVILDESQVIKNPSSKLYRAMMLLNAKFRMVLTGTPIENSLTDLWAQLNFINKGLLGSLNFFKREFVAPIEKKNDADTEDKLKKLINPFILRRTKEEVAKELPDMCDQLILCNMTDEQRSFYNEEKSTIRRSILERIDSEGIEKSAMIVLQGLTRLRQISNHPVLVDENYREDSGKYNEIMRNIDSVIAEGHKVLIFSSFVKHLKLVRDYLQKQDLKFAYLTGESTNREEIIKKFQEEVDCRIFLISLKAGGVGLNLTAADYVFILDPWWNPASEEQAINRAHRIGQDKNVFVYRFIAENSIEEKIQSMQTRKTQLAETFIKSNNPMKDISRKELEELFN